jgi:ABC-type branched-subunit amino acid transport system substrate-binding protein
MSSTIQPSLALAAVALRQSHPQVPPLEVLDLVMRQHSGSVADFGDATWPTAPFGQLLAACFDRGMSPDEWRMIDTSPDQQFVDALHTVWGDVVLASFAARYSLSR